MKNKKEKEKISRLGVIQIIKGERKMKYGYIHIHSLPNEWGETQNEQLRKDLHVDELVIDTDCGRIFATAKYKAMESMLKEGDTVVIAPLPRYKILLPSFATLDAFLQKMKSMNVTVILQTGDGLCDVESEEGIELLELLKEIDEGERRKLRERLGANKK